jgi:ABC-type transport system substrate-binding protein
MRLLNDSGRSSVTTELKEIIYSDTLLGSSSKTINLPAFQQFDLRTVYLKSGTADPVSIQILDGTTTKNIVYQSNKDVLTYDIVNIPISDKDKTGNIHFNIINHGPASNQVYVKIQLTSF